MSRDREAGKDTFQKDPLRKDPQKDPWRTAPVIVAQIPEAGLHREFEADSAALGGMAELAGVREIVSARAAFDLALTSDGRVHVTGRVRAKVLVCHGDKDPLVKREAIDAFMADMRRDKVDWQFVYYGIAAHSFTDTTADQRGNPAFAYSKATEERSWAAMRHLFEEVFG